MHQSSARTCKYTDTQKDASARVNAEMHGGIGYRQHGTAHNTCKKKKKRTMQCQKAERGRHFRHSCPHPRASLSGCCAPLPRRKPRCVRYLDRSMIEGNERSPLLQRLEPEHRTKQNTKEVLKKCEGREPNTPPQSHTTN